MHNFRFLVLILIAFFGLHVPLGFAFSPSVSKHVLHRRAGFLYQAQGDSYAAGPGAGELMTRASLCQQSTESYPNFLNKLINNGANITLDSHQACVGATAEDLMKSQRLDPLVELVTMSVGLEYINFTQIVNDCVYRFKARESGNCDETIAVTLDKVEAELVSPVRKMIENALEGDRVSSFQLYLVGFAKFWNSETDQCDKAFWTFWSEKSFDVEENLMTKERRRIMNNWIARVNEILNDVVETFRNEGETRVHFVDIDTAFEGHRFCEEGVIEPQQNDEPRPEAYLFQYQTSRDQRWGANDMAAAVGPGAEWTRLIAAGYYVGLEMNKDYASQPIGVHGEYRSTIPIFMSKIFHPTPAGHYAIAAAITDAIDTATRADGSIEARGLEGSGVLVEQQATCGGDLSLNFPKFFVLEDGRFSTSQILLRIRDQACRGVCDKVPGIPENVIQWQRQYLTGCEYAVKIGAKHELYFYTSEAGDNCQTVTTELIDHCMTEKDDVTPIRSSGSLSGPSHGELYSVGVRPVNGEGSNHPKFPDSYDHLPSRQISCTTDHNIFYIPYSIQISLWDDGEEGQSINRMLEDGLTDDVAKFRWKDPKGFYFRDGTQAEHRITWRMPHTSGLWPGEYPETELDKFFKLEPGSIRCEGGIWRDVPIFKDDANYDLTSNEVFGIDVIIDLE